MELPRRQPIRYLLLLKGYLRENGADFGALMTAAGVNEKRQSDRNASLLPREVEAFVAGAKAATGRTDIAFEFGRLIKMTSHDLLGYGLLSCRNADEFLRLASRHYALITEFFTMKYQRRGPKAEVLYTPTTALPRELLHFFIETLATTHHHQLQLLLGADVESYDLFLSIPEPPHAARYRELGSARSHFNDLAPPGLRVTMSGAMLDRPLPLADAAVVQQIDERCQALAALRVPPDETHWGDYVTMVLQETPGGQMTLGGVARRANISVRTLDRHLKKENLSFRDLAHRVRIERARALLGVPGATVAQVALVLGFSDASNFSRAFRRMLGMSPRQYQLQSRRMQPEQRDEHQPAA